MIDNPAIRQKIKQAIIEEIQNDADFKAALQELLRVP